MNRKQRRALATSKNPQDLSQIADLHKKQGQLGKAEQCYREALALDPRCYEAHNNLASILRDTGRLSEAKKHFSAAFDINPKDPVVVLNLAIVLAGEKRFSDAVPFHREALALNPSNAKALSALAHTFTQMAEYSQAEHHYMEALKIDPLDFETRINLGLALVDQGKIAKAFEQAEILSRAEAVAEFPHKAFGILLARVGCPDGAKLCFEKHLSCHPRDRDEIAMLLAAVGGALPTRATDEQISRLYGPRAHGWDEGAGGTSGYQGHQLIAAALVRLDAHRADTVVDAGCGTGLVGELVRPHVRYLIGVDMSEPMLAQARQKNVYDKLHCGDLIEYLKRHERICDVITSAATLIHFGKLDSIFEAVSRSLRPAGLFIFTVFPNDENPDAVEVATLTGLAQGGCFRHGADYIARTAAEHGFAVELLSREVHEYTRNAPVSGLVVALRLPG